MEGQMMNKYSSPTIERVPKELLKGENYELKNNSQVSQFWLINGTRWPKDTIPIRQSTDNMKKQHHYYRKPQSPNCNIEHALAVYSAPRQIMGAEATMNVWNPVVEENNEFSLAQISIKHGEDEYIEAGWHVFPSLYGDKKTRFYIYSTQGGMGGTGCYNKFCKGFEQISEDVILGLSLTPSSFKGNQFAITILIKKDVGGHWSLTCKGNLIGSWKRNIFNHLKGSGSIVEWGGKVCNTRPNNRHTATSMGGGRFAEAGFGMASYFRDIKVQNLNGGFKPVDQQSLSPRMTKNNCYNIIILPQIDAHGNYFYYGGPGVGPNCP